MPTSPEVVVRGLPRFVDVERLLGPGGWTIAYDVDGTRTASAHLSRGDAADVAARLRGVGLGGRALEVSVAPPPSRDLVRKARLADARRRRDVTPGFVRHGTRLDEEGRMSLTPEVLALAIARRVAGQHVVDATCGCGGNAIAFAREGCRVTAIDTSAERLAMARHNAGVYGAAERITFVQGDARELVAAMRDVDVVFVDPPWGADWNRERTDLASLPLLRELLPLARRWLAKVPPSFDPKELPDAEPIALFGEGPGDFRRVKLVLLASARS